MPLQREAIVEKDIVLVHLENKPAFFARVERIEPDYKRGWWQVKLFVLALPMQVVTWIIDNEQVRGADFTMGGVPVRIEKVAPPLEPEPAKSEHESVSQEISSQPTEPRKQARILSFGKRPAE